MGRVEADLMERGYRKFAPEAWRRTLHAEDGNVIVATIREILSSGRGHFQVRSTSGKHYCAGSVNTLEEAATVAETYLETQVGELAITENHSAVATTLIETAMKDLEDARAEIGLGRPRRARAIIEDRAWAHIQLAAGHLDQAKSEAGDDEPGRPDRHADRGEQARPSP